MDKSVYKLSIRWLIPASFFFKFNKNEQLRKGQATDWWFKMDVSSATFNDLCSNSNFVSPLCCFGVGTCKYWPAPVHSSCTACLWSTSGPRSDSDSGQHPAGNHFSKEKMFFLYIDLKAFYLQCSNHILLRSHRQRYSKDSSSSTSSQMDR